MWALIVDGVVVETTDIDPDGRFHESLVWVACDSAVVAGWIYDGEGFKEPAPQWDELYAAERAWRDLQLNATEWLVSRHRDEIDLQRETSLTAVQYAELLTYRQELRDWPQDGVFPGVSGRPTRPEWLATDGTVVVASEPAAA